MNILTVINLKKVFGKGDTKVTAINDVSFSVGQGEIVLIMGPSGSGKTTLLSMMGGLLTPTAGDITINEVNITQAKRRAVPRIRLYEIGFVFQSFNILQNLTALENVQIVGELAGMPSYQAKERAMELLTKLHMEPRWHYLPVKLSGGQQQRVAIARAIMNNPKLVLADEPTGNLDSKSGHEVMMLFHNIAKADHKTVVIVSHDERIKDIADRVLWIEDGKVSTAPPEPEVTVKDLVCGMKVDAKYSPFSTTIEGKNYTFCSEDCKIKFVEHPYQYVPTLHSSGLDKITG
ncbi:MAG: ATP-binding cassette domain-containing protein [Candidatus Kerfeldbacteria bacterium]|nr:ATP-binding cassette domain-containing protein [Candidatus Kerfeldbacteria bacterium]